MRKIMFMAHWLVVALALGSCGSPFIRLGAVFSGELNEDSEREVKYSSDGGYIGTFCSNYHRFTVEQFKSYRVTVTCAEGGYAIIDDESGGDFDADDTDIQIHNGMGIGSGTWSPGESGTVTLRLYCREEHIPLAYSILIE
jgi:hypothetical protein